MSSVCCNISYMASVYDPKEFAAWLTGAFESSHYKSWQAVADDVGTTRSTLSRLAGAKPQTLTLKPGQPSADLVIRLAEIFRKDVDDALMKGGHAPINRRRDEDGLYSGYDELPPDRKQLARRQIRAILASLADPEDHDREN